jgi:hypothetical protein
LELAQPQAEKIKVILNEMLASVAQACKEMKDERIQTRTKNENENGLFDYRYDQLTLVEIFQKHDFAELNFTAFVDKCFEELIERTRRNLVEVRRDVSQRFGGLLSMIITGAESKSASVLQTAPFYDLRDALSRCRNDVESAVKGMNGWFEGSDATLMGDVSMSLVVNTAAGMACRLYPGARGRIKTAANSNYRLQGRFFTTFIHMLYFLIDNAVQHSGVLPEELDVGVTLTALDSRISVVVVNSMSVTAAAGEAVAVINKQLIALQRTLDSAKVRSEGGSGLAKVVATLKHEFRSSIMLNEATLTDDGRVQVRLEFPVAGVCA